MGLQGEYFGEVALLKRDVRAANVTAASTGCRVLAMTRDVRRARSAAGPRIPSFRTSFCSIAFLLSRSRPNARRLPLPPPFLFHAACPQTFERMQSASHRAHSTLKTVIRGYQPVAFKLAITSLKDLKACGAVNDAAERRWGTSFRAILLSRKED